MGLIKFLEHKRIRYKFFMYIFSFDTDYRFKIETDIKNLKNDRKWFKLFSFFILYKLAMMPDTLDRKLKSIYWWIMYRTTQRYHIVDTKLKPSYYDVDVRLTEACFSLLIDFVEKEYVYDVKMWNNLPKDMSIEDVFSFALTFRPDDKKLHDIYRYCKSRGDDIINNDFLLETQDNEDTKWLIELIKIRGNLWT